MNIFAMIDLILLGFVLIKNCAKLLQSNSTGLDIGLVNHHSWSGFRLIDFTTPPNRHRLLPFNLGLFAFSVCLFFLGWITFPLKPSIKIVS
jgi:hypothetical protein